MTIASRQGHIHTLQVYSIYTKINYNIYLSTVKLSRLTPTSQGNEEAIYRINAGVNITHKCSTIQKYGNSINAIVIYGNETFSNVHPWLGALL